MESPPAEPHTPGRRPLGAQIVRNVAFSGLRLFVLAVLPLVMTPLYLRHLGAGDYGTWAVFLAAINLTALADLGLAGTLSKHVAEASARRDESGLGRILGAGLALYATIAMTLAVAMWWGSPLIASALTGTNPRPLEELVTLWRYVGLVVAINVMSLMFSSVLVGMQRLDLMSLVQAGNAALAAALSVALLSAGWSLQALPAAALLAGVLTLLAYATLARATIPRLHLGRVVARWADIRELMSFSLKLHVTQVAVTIHNQVEKIYLAALVAVTPVGWYEIAAEFARLRHIPNVVLSPVMPAAAELHALGDSRRVGELFRRAHRYLAFASFPLLGLASVVASDFMAVWLGPDFRFLAVPGLALLAVGLVNLATGPSFLILVARGDLGPGIRSAVVGMALNVALSYVLIRLMGFPGAVVGTCLSLGVAALFFLAISSRRLGFSLRDAMRASYPKPFAAAGISAALTWFLLGPRSTWLELLGSALAFTTLYIIFLAATRFFDEEDLSVLKKLRSALG